jgi:predicted SprT family Zn-dependent metalloprotease
VTPQQQQIVDACKASFVKAKELYPHLNFDAVGIRFDLVGRCAGMAHRRGTHYFMRFNRDMLNREAFDHILNDTVPHEVAHIVCFMDPRLGRNHDYGWANVCRKLGGTGARTHKEEVVYGKGLTYEYTTTTGQKVRISQQLHSRMHQRGATYTYRGGKGAINKNCAHQVVGANGRTLNEPVRKVEAKTPGVLPAPVFRPVAPVVPTALQLENQRRIDEWKARVVVPVAPVAPVVRPVVQTPVAAFDKGQSKAAISRAIMLSGYRGGQTYEQIITAMIAANGYDRQLARATFKANAPKVGIPSDWGL